MPETTNTPKDLALLIDANLQLPTIPAVASRALRAMEDPMANAQTLAIILQEDPGLTARILGVANSALYSLPRKIGNLAQAAMILGFVGLRSLVVAAATQALYKNYGALERSLWLHSVGAAHAAQAIAKKKNFPHGDEAFVAGLMHDIGHIVMNNSLRDRFADVLTRSKLDDRPLDEIEREHFGFTHADVGSLLVSRWGLSPSLEHAIFLHHDLELAETIAEDACDLVYATHMANLIVHSIGTAPVVSQTPIDLWASPATEALGLNENDIEDIQQRVKEHQSELE